MPTSITFKTADASELKALSPAEAKDLLNALSLHTLADALNSKLKVLADKIGIDKVHQLKKDEKVIRLVEVQRGSPLPKDFRDLIQSTRSDLYERAKEEDVSGRGSMSKADFVAHFAEELNADAAYYDPDPVDSDGPYLALLTPDFDEVIGYAPKEIWAGLSTYGIPDSWEGIIKKREESKPFYQKMYWDRVLKDPPPGTPIQTPPNLRMTEYLQAEETVKQALSSADNS